MRRVAACAQCTVMMTPALWATRTTGPSTEFDHLVECGDPGGAAELVVFERRNGDRVVELLGQEGLPVLGDVIAKAGHDHHGRTFEVRS